MTTEDLVRRDRLVAGAGIAAVALLAWAWLAQLAHELHRPEAISAVARPHVMPWGLADAGLAFLMWAVMMAAMMLPSAAPMIVTFAGVNSRRTARAAPVPTIVFVAGYLALWTAFSALAALAQWGLQRAALLSADGMVAAPRVAGVLLAVAGVYQLTPLKAACLARCESPLRFVLGSWREGPGGALVMGLRHGAFCIGCCWALMALLFVAGVMNLVWVAALATLVLLEKVTPIGRLVATVSGVLAIGWGAFLLFRTA